MVVGVLDKAAAEDFIMLVEDAVVVGVLDKAAAEDFIEAAVVVRVALWSGVVPNPLRTAWFQTTWRSCAEVWAKRVSTENQLKTFRSQNSQL
jgi:hypothetical protein